MPLDGPEIEQAAKVIASGLPGLVDLIAPGSGRAARRRPIP